MFYDKYIQLCNSIRKTPSAVALEIGISKPTVSRWKSGSVPHYATMRKVADYFGVSIDYLKKEERPTAQDDEPNDENYQILKDFIINASVEELAATRQIIEIIKNSKGR